VVTGSDIVSVAKTYVGTPFHHLGRVKNLGIDCVGIILGVAKELEIPLVIHPDFERYGRRTKNLSLLEYMDEQFLILKKREVGSIAVSWWDQQTKEPSHLGIVTSIGMVHTNGHLKIAIEEHWSPKWVTRIVAFYKYPGVI
jgi:cell wall-associated NlpC family hydrolase